MSEVTPGNYLSKVATTVAAIFNKAVFSIWSIRRDTIPYGCNDNSIVNVTVVLDFIYIYLVYSIKHQLISREDHCEGHTYNVLRHVLAVVSHSSWQWLSFLVELLRHSQPILPVKRRDIVVVNVCSRVFIEMKKMKRNRISKLLYCNLDPGI